MKLTDQGKKDRELLDKHCLTWGVLLGGQTKKCKFNKKLKNKKDVLLLTIPVNPGCVWTIYNDDNSVSFYNTTDTTILYAIKESPDIDSSIIELALGRVF